MATGTKTKVSDLYYVRLADTEDERDEILRLWHLLPGSGKPRDEKLSWFYIRNPAGQGTIFFLIFKPENRAVGVMCAGRRDFRLRENIYRGAVFGDFVIEPEHRSLGPGLMLQRKSLEYAFDHYDLFYGFPGDAAARLSQFDGHNFKSDLASMVLPLSTFEFACRYMPSWLARPICYLQSQVSANYLKLKTRSNIRNFDKVEADESFVDRLWKNGEFGTQAAGIRDWAFIRWRVQLDPFNKYHLFGVCDKNAEPAGYIVYKTIEEQKVLVVDYSATSHSAFAALIAHLVRIGLTQSTTSIWIDIPENDITKCHLLQSLIFLRWNVRKAFVTVSGHRTFDIEEDSIYLTLLDNDV